MRLNAFLATLLGLAMTFFVSASFADGGNGGGGGGNEFVAQFVSAAYSLLDSNIFSTEDRATIESGLNNAKVRTVPVLTAGDGTPVPDQKLLIAWTVVTVTPEGVKADIQLKERPAHDDGGDSWQARYERHQPLAQEVIHELIRASNRLNPDTGKSIDDLYAISIHKYHLDSQIMTEELKTQALESIYVMKDMGSEYCLQLHEANGDTREQIAACRQVVEDEAQIGYMIIAGDKVDQTVLLHRWIDDGDKTCKLLWASPSNRLNEKCAKIEDYKRRQVFDVLKGISDIHILQSATDTWTSEIEEAYHGSLAHYQKSTYDAYKIYIQAFSQMVSALVKPAH